MTQEGRSTPEIGLLVELADLFEISVDALLGYEYRNNDREHTLKRLHEYAQNVSREALADAEKALKKYPNNFEIVYTSTNLYMAYGIKQKDKHLLHRALELAERSYLLIDQNHDETISEVSIRIDMATIYVELGELDMAIELLKANNPCGINNARIGDILTRTDAEEELAVSFLSQALLDCLIKQSEIVNGYTSVFSKKKEWEKVRKILRWEATSCAILEREEPSFLCKAEARLWGMDAVCCIQLGKVQEARTALEKALEKAEKYDKNPSNDVNRISFVTLTEPKSSYDNLGATAKKAVEIVILESENQELQKIWEELCHEK